MERVSGVYRITINEKSYIGSSVFIQQRWRQHRTDLKCGRHANPILQNAYNKYKNVKFEIIEEMPGATDEELRKREKYYLNLYKAEYNLGDPVTNFNVKPVYQFTLSGEFIKKYPDVYKAAEELGISYSNIMHAAQENEKCTRTAGGFFWRYTDTITFEKDKRWREIHVYTLKGDYIRSFDSAKDCIKELKLPQQKYAKGRINRVCRGLAGSFGGYRFSYEKVNKLDNSKLLSIKCCFPIVQISKDKKQGIRVFESSAKAGKILKFDGNTIADAVNRGLMYRGYYWTRLGTKWSELLEYPEDTEATK